MYYMPVITLRVTDAQKEAWVELAGGTQKLSAWIRSRCDGVLAEAVGTNGGNAVREEREALDAIATPMRVTAPTVSASTPRVSRTSGSAHIKLNRFAEECPSRKFKDGVCVECGRPAE